MSRRNDILTLLIQMAVAVARIIWKADAVVCVIRRTVALTLGIHKE